MGKVFSLLCLAATPLVLQAQSVEPDAEGCKDSTLVTRLPGCRITECDIKSFDSVEMTIGRKDDLIGKTLEGAKELINYECQASASALQIARNLQGALTKAGYKIVYNGKGDNEQPMVTAQTGAQWIEIYTWDNGGTVNYRQTALKVEQMQQQVTASADAWAAEIEKNGRVSVYGINFATGKADVTAESESVLNEIVTLLNNQSDWKLRVEGHTDSVGAKAANQVLSQKRAEAVVAWLAAHGIDRSRLSAQGFGDTKPLADNTTDDGRAKNRRVELVKM